MGYRKAPDEPGRPSRGAGWAPRRSDARRRLSSLRRDESGQSLLIVVIGLTVIVLMSALAIDASEWFVKHHQAQVTADAAALAAANYMGNYSTVANASSTATSTATTYAADNGLPIANSNVTVNASAKTVTVSVPTTGLLAFAGVSLQTGPSISARAVASWAIRDCADANAGSGCAFAYAGDNVCSGTTGVSGTLGNNTTATIGHGITFNDNGASQRVIGDVISASNLDTSGINRQNHWSSAALYSNSAGCYGPLQGSPYINPFTAALQNAVASSYPVDYRTIFTACSGASCHSDLYPNYCTQAYDGVSSVSSIPANGTTVYCNAGTGNKSDPRTWNGVINVTSGGNATFIAGMVTMTIPNNLTLGPSAGTNLLAYAADCNATTPSLPATCPATVTSGITSPAISLSTPSNGSGHTAVTGDLFAPAGVIDSNLGGTPSVTGFLEAWDIAYNVNGTVLGQGPPVNSSVQFVGDYLIQ